jgi:hypothetical protein
MTIESQAAIESGLAQEYANDPALLAFYQRRLLKKGWAGTKTPTENKYVALVNKALGKYQGVGERLAESLQRHRKALSEDCTGDNG